MGFEEATQPNTAVRCLECGELNSSYAESCVMCQTLFGVGSASFPKANASKNASAMKEKPVVIATPEEPMERSKTGWLVVYGFLAFTAVAGFGINHFLNYPGTRDHTIEKPLSSLSSPRSVSRSNDASFNFTEQELAQAASVGDIEKVKKLLQNGVRASAMARLGVPALGIAATKGHTEIVRLLLDSGCDVNIKARDRTLSGELIGGFTALHTASAKGNEEIVKLLLEKGANVHLVSATNDTALNFAATNGKTNTMRLLIEAGSDVNHRGHLNATPLIITSSLGHTECVRLLIDKDADVQARVENGYSALTYAEEKGHREIAQMLRDRGAR